MKTLNKEYLIASSASLLVMAISLVFWHTGDPEIQLEYNLTNISIVVLLYLIFLSGICCLKYFQYQRLSDSKLFYQRVGFSITMLSFLALAGVFYYLMLGLLFVIFTSTFLDYLKPPRAWFLALSMPIITGTYDVFVKDMSFYLEIKLLFIVINSLVLVSGSKIKSEQKAKEQASQLLRELQATQHLLESSVKRDERLRIARDLHDSMGHKLTALKLQLELATHIEPSQVQNKIAIAKNLSGALLEDVRNNVNEFRDSNVIELNNAIKALIPDIASIDFELYTNVNEQSLSNRQAETLFRCVQESITNVMRHSKANHCLIELQQNDQEVLLRIQDNGKTVRQLEKPGYGLKGMSERIKALDGEMDSGFNKSGFEVKLSLPLNRVH